MPIVFSPTQYNRWSDRRLFEDPKNPAMTKGRVDSSTAALDFLKRTVKEVDSELGNYKDIFEGPRFGKPGRAGVAFLINLHAVWKIWHGLETRMYPLGG